MTNKEQIIIDGVDVSGCVYFIDHEPTIEQGTWCGAIHKSACKIYSKDCKYNNNCYFKQLARKTQECEELKKYIQANQPTGICETCTAKALLENDKYRQSLKEIEEYLDAQQKYFDGEDYHNLLDIINKAKGEL